MADKCIGKLTQDISDVEKKVAQINEALSKAGSKVNVNLSKEIGKEVKAQLDAVLKEIEGYSKKISDSVNKAADDASRNAGKVADQKGLKEAVALWKEYYSLMTKAQNATNSGRTSQASYYQTEAAAIRERAKALREEADIEKELEKVKRSYNAAIQAGADKTIAKNAQENARAAKEQANAQKELQKIIEASAKAREKAQGIADNAAMRDEQKRLETIIDLYKTKIQLDTEATKAVAAGNMDNASLFLGEEAKIQSIIDAVKQLYPELDKLAQADKRVVDAELQRQAAVNTAKQKSEEIDYRAQQEAINEYANALINLYNEQAKLNSAVATGKIVEGSEEYSAATAKINHFEEAVVQAGSKLDEAGIKAANGMSKVQAAADSLVQSEAKLNDSAAVSPQERAQSAYQNLTNAIKNYNIAKKSSNEDGMAYWQAQINSSMVVVGNLEKEIGSLNVDEATRQRILSLIEQSKTAQAGFTAEQNKSVSGANELNNQISSLLTRYFSIIAVIRTINSLISNTVEYVSEYSNKMNEIQIITGKSSSEIDQLAKTYRDMAADMSVSSLDMADAAIYFTRQGLAAAEVETRLKNTTMYAKTANIEFETAAELITSVVNSMNLEDQALEDGRNAAQRVADVFLKIGDNAATSGKEIGEAMQKAGAAAGAFNMNFEWLASYIATVSETTRQEATSIGTAFNTLIARLHSIRTTGFNSEDETKINDIQKALNNVNVSLLDQEGNWRDITTIFQEVADQWDTLDGKTKSYIATTMAGVKQQNVFLALMEDLSQRTEGTSRAWELYNLALESSGTAQGKYAIYTDSVAAAQERLTVAQEKFYSLLDDSVIKGWYNGLAGFVDMIAEGAEKTNGWSIALPVLAGALTGVAVVIKSINAGILTTVGIMETFKAHPIVMAISAAVLVMGGLVTAINAIASAGETAEEQIQRLNKVISDSQEKVSKYTSMQGELTGLFGEMSEEGADTNKVLETHNGLLESLAGLSETAKNAVDGQTGGWMAEADAQKILNEELKEKIQNEQIAQAAAYVEKAETHEETPAESFAKRLIANGIDVNHMTQDDMAIVGEILPSDIYKDVFLKEYDLYKNLYSDDEAWMKAGEAAIKSFLSGMTAEDYLADQANKMIDEFMNVASMTMSSGDARIVRSQLDKAIFGNDGELTVEEFNSIHNLLANFMKELASVSFDPREFIDPEMQIVSLGESIFGIYFDMLFGDQIDDLLDKDYYAQMISEGITEQIDAGFSDNDIWQLLKDTPLVDWDKMVDMMKNQLKDSIKKSFGLKELGEYIDFGDGTAVWSEGMWGELSLPALQYIDKLASSGVPWHEISSLMDQFSNEETNDVIGFTNALYEMGEAAGVVEEATEESADSFESMINRMKTPASQIKDINSALASLKSGKDLSSSEFYGLAEQYPSIFRAFGDKQELTRMLEDIQGAIKQKTEADIMNSEDIFANSPFALFSITSKKGIKTLAEFKEAVSSFSGTSQLEGYVQSLVDSFLGLSDAEEEAEEATESWLQTQAKAAREQMSANWSKSNGYISEITALQDAFEQNGAGGMLKVWNTFSDTIKEDIKNTYPNLIATLGDVESAYGKVAKQAEENKRAELSSVGQDVNILDVEVHPSDKAKKYIKYFVPEWYDGNVDLTNRKIVPLDVVLQVNPQDVELLSGDEPGYATFWSTEFWEHDAALNKDVVLHISTIDSKGNPWSPEEVDSYVSALVDESERTGKTIKEIDAGWEKMLLHIEEVKETDIGYGSEDLAEHYAEAQQRTEEWHDAFMKYQNAWDEFRYKNDWFGEEQIDETNAYGESLEHAQEELVNAADSTGELEKATGAFNDEIKDTKKYINTKYLKDTAKAMKDLREGTISASDAYETAYKDANKVSKAYEDVNDVLEKQSKGINAETKDVSNLASVLGLSAEQILENFPAAVLELDNVAEAGRQMFEALNKEATMKILGVSEADFSNIMNGMAAVQNTADATIQMLLSLGNFELEEREVKEGVTFPIYENGKLSYITAPATGKYQFLVPTGNNAFGNYKGKGGGGGSSSSNKSGGGGGGGGNKNSMTEIERSLDRMSQLHDIQNAQRSYYQAQSGYYEQQGMLQGVIAYAQKEIEVLEDQNDALDKNIAQIETYMEAKRKELASMSTSDENYEEVADDLDKLQKAHQTYTVDLINNKTAIDQLNESMKEQQRNIRQMKIDIRQLVYSAIEDREEKAKSMLEGEIELEDKLLELIMKRYEKEWDEIQKVTNKRIEFLEEENDLLDEQLRLRKEAAEEEEKQTELAELEAQYQRIIADPTRQKEALEIQKKIKKLRDEIAWDTTEKEVEAQKKANDAQKKNLEDYLEYTEEYYQDIFDHPSKLIEEMKELTGKTDDEIIAFLRSNDEEYAEATDNKKKKLEQDWQDMLDTMRGKITVYWEEVEEIIAQGDEAIIDFLKANSKDYAEAGRLEAEAYVDEWMDKLKELHDALEEVVPVSAPDDYVVIDEATGSGSGGGGGGGNSKGGGKTTETDTGKKTSWTTTNLTKGMADTKIGDVRTTIYTYNNAAVPSTTTTGGSGKLSLDGILKRDARDEENQKKLSQKKILSNATGGMVDYTGLAWLDGSITDPERVLSPYQTKLFETMVSVLEQASRVSVPSMPNYDGIGYGGSSPVSVGDIIVQVENLDTDDDYETLAEKVSEILMERIGRTTAIGGLRISSY